MDSGQILIEKTTATVYVSHGRTRRRFFTVRGAARHSASFAMKKKYPCTCEEETHYDCGNHTAYMVELFDRYARILAYRFIHQLKD